MHFTHRFGFETLRPTFPVLELFSTTLFLVSISNDPPQNRNPAFTCFTESLSGLGYVDLHLLKTYTSRLREVVDCGGADISASAYLSMVAGETCLDIANALTPTQQIVKTAVDDENDDDKEVTSSQLLLQLALKRLSSVPHGPVLTEKWQRKGYLDVHSKLLFSEV